MTGNAYPAALRRVIINLSRWPGVGEKTASRMAMHLLRAPEAEVLELANALMELKAKIRLCRRCFAFADQELYLRRGQSVERVRCGGVPDASAVQRQSLVPARDRRLVPVAGRGGPEAGGATCRLARVSTSPRAR